MNHFTFFWSGPFSQWYSSPFKIGQQEFSCAEQYMMWRKAKHFNDEETAQLILNTKNPKEQKQLGRQVKNFNDAEWIEIAKDVVTVASIAKYSQNPELKKELFATADTILVEASPYDRRWGIGLKATDPRAQNPAQWQGTNWLGEILTEVRDYLMELEQRNETTET